MKILLSLAMMNQVTAVLPVLMSFGMMTISVRLTPVILMTSACMCPSVLGLRPAILYMEAVPLGPIFVPQTTTPTSS